MTAAKHTPLPWAYVRDDLMGSRVVADHAGFSAPYRSVPGTGPCPTQDADNRLIVTAVNSHHGLLAACEAVMEFWESHEAWGDFASLTSAAGAFAPVVDKARAAISKARGGK